MSKQIDVLKMALEALESCDSTYDWNGDGDEYQVDVYDIDKVNKAITAIKEALQSNEQEINPKTTFDEVERGLQQSRMVIATLDSITTEQRQQINERLLKAQLFLKAISKAVTETAIQQSNEQVEPVRHQNCGTGHCSCGECVMTPTLVAWANAEEQSEDDFQDGYEAARRWVRDVGLKEEPAQPPQRKPLTDEQIFVIKHNWITTPFVNHLDFARAIEAAHGIKE